MEKAGITIPLVVAEDGQDAIDYLNEFRKGPHLSGRARTIVIVLDLRMPRLDGWGVIEWIRSQPEISEMQVVVLSVSERAADRERAKSLGVIKYCVKPVEPRDLVEMLQGPAR